MRVKCINTNKTGYLILGTIYNVLNTHVSPHSREAKQDDCYIIFNGHENFGYRKTRFQVISGNPKEINPFSISIS